MLTFGIVIPNLNQTHFIRTALESLRHQTQPVQVDIMDGGSNDNIHEVYKEYKDEVTYFTSKKDNGQSAAIKEGWERIGGDIIAWLNADDYLFPDALKKISDSFENDSDLDVVYGDAVHVTENGSFLGYFPAIKPFERSRIGIDNYICQPACFIRRSAYEKISGIDEKIKYTMDWDLWCRLAASGAKFKYLKLPLAAVRYYEGTKTLTRSIKRYLEIAKIEKKYGNRLIPISVIGADFYGLSLKRKLTKTQRIYMAAFKCLRKIKRSVFMKELKGNQDETLYGLSRWDNISFSKCCIHLPWYIKAQPWNHIKLDLVPANEDYEITINGEKIEPSINSKFQRKIFLQQKYAPHIQMEISSNTAQNWAIKKFECVSINR